MMDENGNIATTSIKPATDPLSLMVVAMVPH